MTILMLSFPLPSFLHSFIHFLLSCLPHTGLSQLIYLQTIHCSSVNSKLFTSSCTFSVFRYCTFTYFLKVYQHFSLMLCRYGYLYTRTVVMWAQGVRPHRAKATEGWELSDVSAENRIFSHWAISLSPTFQLLNFYYYISLIIFNIW